MTSQKDFMTKSTKNDNIFILQENTIKKPPLCKGRWVAKQLGGIAMKYKHNKEIVPLAKALRMNMTKEEKRLWYDYLREYPIRFIRQKVIGQYIVDFYCAKAKLVVELDGSQHYDDKGIEKDALRTEFLEQYGLEVIRISNLDINKNFEGVCIFIDNKVKQSLSQLR